MSFLNNELKFSAILEPIFLPEERFNKRFAKKTRLEDPYVRVYDICDDTENNNSRVAIKDYSASTNQQRSDVLMNLESYRNLQQIQGICKLISFCQLQSTGDIIAAFQYNDSTLQELITAQFFQDNRNQFYLFIIKELLFVFQNAKSIGIELEDLIPSNIILYKVESHFRMKILYDQREKKFDKIFEGIKVYCSIESIQASLGIIMEEHQQNKEFVFELGLLLLDVIYSYEITSKRGSNKEVGRNYDLNYKGYHIFEDNSNIKLNQFLINQKKNFLISLNEPFLVEIVELISTMICPIHSRINLQDLMFNSEKLFETNDTENLDSSYSSPQKQISPIKQKFSPSDSLKYSEETSNHFIQNMKNVATETTITKNVFMDSYNQIDSKNTNFSQTVITYNLIPKNKIMSEINVHKNIKEQLLKFITILENRNTVVKKEYLDGGIYYGELDEVSHKRQGLGMYFYTHGDVYFGNWKENVLIDGIYIFKNSQCFEGVVKNGKQGWGRYYYSNGNIYEGDWKDDLKSGRGKMNYSNGEVYEGMWVKGKKSGQGVYNYLDGSIYKGSYVNGKKSGFGCVLFSDHTKVEAFWVENHIEGKGKIFYNNGHYYEGDFYFSFKQGQGIYKWQDQTRYEGQFKNDVMLGQARIKYIENQYYEGKISNGKREGYGIYRYPNGDQFKGQWKNDEKFIGQYKFHDGRSFDGKFKKNEMSYGVMIYENGDSYEGELSKGERHGLGLYRNSAGGIMFDGKWGKDKFVSNI